MDLFTTEAAGLILTIVFLDGILSIDNALANAAIAQDLPEHRRSLAIRLGLVLGALFRIVALFFASVIARVPLIRIAGGLYLLYLVWGHFWGPAETPREMRSARHFRAVAWEIGLTDLVFSIDNVVATIGISRNLYIVSIGVMASIVVMMFATQILELLMRRYRRLADLAFVIIAFIAFSIFAGDGYHLPLLGHVPHFDIGNIFKFGIIASAIVLTIGYEEIVRFGKHRRHKVAGDCVGVILSRVAPARDAGESSGVIRALPREPGTGGSRRAGRPRTAPGPRSPF